MNVDVRNGLVAGAISAVIAFLAWTFLGQASIAAALIAAVLFFVGTGVVTALVARTIRSAHASR